MWEKLLPLFRVLIFFSAQEAQDDEEGELMGENISKKKQQKEKKLFRQLEKEKCFRMKRKRKSPVNKVNLVHYGRAENNMKIWWNQISLNVWRVSVSSGTEGGGKGQVRSSIVLNKFRKEKNETQNGADLLKP